MAELVLVDPKCPLPRDPEKWREALKSHRSFQQQVEEVIRDISASDKAEEFWRLRDARNHQEAKEGSLFADDYAAVNLSRDFAKRHAAKYPEVAVAPWEAIRSAMNKALKKANLHRKRDDSENISGPSED